MKELNDIIVFREYIAAKRFNDDFYSPLNAYFQLDFQSLNKIFK